MDSGGWLSSLMAPASLNSQHCDEADRSLLKNLHRCTHVLMRETQIVLFKNMCIMFLGRNNSEQGLRQMSQADKVQCNFLSEVNTHSSSRKWVKDDSRRWWDDSRNYTWQFGEKLRREQGLPGPFSWQSYYRVKAGVINKKSKVLFQCLW